MSTATLPAVADGGAAPARTGAETVSAETLEAVMLGGDLARLSPRQRIEWYRGRCEAAGLDPRTQPFQYLQLNGKLVLYATKAATEHLTGLHGLTVEIPDRTINQEMGLCVVRCRVTFPSGRHVEDCGAVSIQGLKGEPLANAILKAVTKAKRRTVLSACGLGMLDDSEADAVDQGRRISRDEAEAGADPPQNNSGFGRGQYASPAQVQQFDDRIRRFVEHINSKWLDEWTGADGEVAEGIRELLRPEQVTRHLLKWALRTGRLAPVGIAFNPETGEQVPNVSSTQARQYVAIVLAREPEALAEEVESYWREKAAEARAEWGRKHGHAAGEDAPGDREPGKDP